MIRKVGIELEGGWEEYPTVPGSMHSDGSVTIRAPYGQEYVSPPLHIERVLDWVYSAYPHVSNASCGLHIHLSVANKGQYSALMDAEYYEGFLAKLRAWGAGYPCTNVNFWRRLNESHPYANNYVDRPHAPDLQVIQRVKHVSRYRHLNYCYLLHGTMEIRVLPVFSAAKTAVSAVKAILDYTNDYLRSHPYQWTVSDNLTMED